MEVQDKERWSNAGGLLSSRLSYAGPRRPQLQPISCNFMLHVRCVHSGFREGLLNS